MEELIERVSAILDSPVLRYNWHKAYRHMLLICLAYLAIFSGSLHGQEPIYSFEPYGNKSEFSITKDSKAYEIYSRHSDLSDMIAVNKASEAMIEVEALLENLETSIKELYDVDPENEEDRHRVLRAFAELDGALSYVYTKLKFAREQLNGIASVTEDEIAQTNSLKVKFMSKMQLCNELRKIIAEKLANAPKKDK